MDKIKTGDRVVGQPLRMWSRRLKWIKGTTTCLGTVIDVLDNRHLLIGWDCVWRGQDDCLVERVHVAMVKRPQALEELAGAAE